MRMRCQIKRAKFQITFCDKLLFVVGMRMHPELQFFVTFHQIREGKALFYARDKSKKDPHYFLWKAPLQQHQICLWPGQVLQSKAQLAGRTSRTSRTGSKGFMTKPCGQELAQMSCWQLIIGHTQSFSQKNCFGGWHEVGHPWWDHTLKQCNDHHPQSLCWKSKSG